MPGAWVGQALMHTVLTAADAVDEPAIVLLGDPGNYRRFGFVLTEPSRIRPTARSQPGRTFPGTTPQHMGRFAARNVPLRVGLRLPGAARCGRKARESPAEGSAAGRRKVAV